MAAHAARAMGVAPATRGMALPCCASRGCPRCVLELGPLDRLVERTAELAGAVADAVEGWTTVES